MKALVLTQYNRFEMQDVPVPALGPEDVLVEVRACGICGSDVHGMDGSTGRRVPPVIMGHEAAGVVARLGSDVGDWAEGDRVTFDSTIYCGRCFFCRQGRINLCDHRRVLGVSCDEYRQDGAMAEYVAVPRHILYRLPEGLDFRRAALVEPLSVAVHAVGRMTLAPDDTVAVIGAGMIGLLVIQALRAAGCRRIIAVDLDAERLALAGRFGAAWQWRADAVDVPAAVARFDRRPRRGRGGRGGRNRPDARDGRRVSSQGRRACTGGQRVAAGRVAATGRRDARTFAPRVLRVARRVPGVPRHDRPRRRRRRSAHERRRGVGRGSTLV